MGHNIFWKSPMCAVNRGHNYVPSISKKIFSFVNHSNSQRYTHVYTQTDRQTDRRTDRQNGSNLE